MDRNKYNNRFKEDILGYQSPVNVDAIWASIEPQVDAINSRPTNRWGFYWFFAIGIALLGTSLVFNPFSKGEASDAVPTNTSAASISPATTMTTSEQPSSDVYDAQNNSAAALEAPSSTAASENDHRNAEAPTPSSSATTIPVEEESTKNSEEPKEQEVKGEEKPPIRPAAAPPIAMAEEVPNMRTVPVETESETTPATVGNDQPLPVLKKDPPLSILGEGFSMLSNRSTAPLPLKKRIISTDDLKDFVPNYGTSQKGLSYSIMFQAGIASTGRKLEGAMDSLGNRLLQNRLNSETPLENIQIALLAGVHHHSGFNLMTGVQFTRIAERFENTEEIITQDSVDGIVKLIVNPNGDTISVPGKVLVTTTTVNRKKYFNSYRLIDVPLLLGYQKAINNLRLGLQAGIFANLNLTTEGRILDEEGLAVDIEAQRDMIFKKTLGVSYYASFSVGYEFSPGMILHFAPYLHHYPGRFTSDNYPLVQKYSLLGIKAGFQYEF